MTQNPLLLLGFLAVFHLIGGIALGIGVRTTWRIVIDQTDSIQRAIFFLIWGCLFGCFPLGFGLQPQLPLWFLVSQIIFLGTVFIITAFLGERALTWLKPLIKVQMLLIFIGIGIVLAGLIGGGIAFNQTSGLLIAIVVSSVFGAIGFGIFLLGVTSLRKNTE